MDLSERSKKQRGGGGLRIREFLAIHLVEIEKYWNPEG